MATYKYTAISKDGVKVSGVVEGFNEFDAVDRIKQDCDIVLKLTEVEEKKPGLLSMEIDPVRPPPSATRQSRTTRIGSKSVKCSLPAIERKRES